jgi:hypothetical protein
MFGHYPYILPNHIVALETSVRKHNNLGTLANPQLLARLYKIAIDGVNTGASLLSAQIHASVIDTKKDIRVSTATDLASGVYLQLVRVDAKANPLLTLGQKWAMEGNNTVQGNSSVTFW